MLNQVLFQRNKKVYNVSIGTVSKKQNDVVTFNKYDVVSLESTKHALHMMPFYNKSFSLKVVTPF